LELFPFFLRDHVQRKSWTNSEEQR
jgi:hypothetical protein